MAFSFVGCLAALVSAAAWAYSSILFRKVGEEASPAAMVLANCGIGLVYMGLLFAVSGMGPVDIRTVLVLGASGLLGVALGGILFFRALMCLGPKLTVIMGLVCPVVTILLAVVLLNERPSPVAWAGSLLIFAGISLVLWKRFPAGVREKAVAGIAYSALSTLCTAASIILAKVGVAEIPALEATFIRQLWAVAGLAAWGCATGTIKAWLIPFKERRLAKLIFFSSFVVIFGGFWLSMVSLKYLDASIATVLSMTEPLFILPFTALLLKEKITLRETAGALIAFAGVVMIFLR
ncbi:MAG: DMT family transporter [Elusimicrobia bacterium]|nr:DMT family transporter [Elusimicrobiota bacterium]